MTRLAELALTGCFSHVNPIICFIECDSIILRKVASLAILADENPAWKPDHYSYELWGSKAGLWFPSIVNLFHNDFDQNTAGAYIKLPFPIDPINLDNLDPLFLDPDNCDLHLTEFSPCIDAGDNDAPEFPAADKDSNPRIICGVVDIGAYEYSACGPPIADFSATPTTGTVPLTVNFTDLSTGTITNWAWDFGDGGTSTAQNPSHIYNIPDTYTVSFTVTGPGGTDTDTDTKIDYITVSSNGWEEAYDTMFRHPSDLTLLRRYRDEFLIKTTKGRLYTKLLYNRSEEALQVLLQNPELMMEAKHLIEANKGAVYEVLNDNEGVIYNTDEIVSFLKAYARKSPPDLKLLAITVEKEMLRQQRQDGTFLGFRLK